MRRGFSILLILFFGLGPLSAFVDGSEDASLPACCRRHGAHHCAMNVRATGDEGAGARRRFFCSANLPDYPDAAIRMLRPGPRSDGYPHRVCRFLCEHVNVRISRRGRA